LSQLLLSGRRGAAPLAFVDVLGLDASRDLLEREAVAAHARQAHRRTLGEGLPDDELSPKLGTEDDDAALQKAQSIDGPTLRRIENSFHFKSPVNVVLTSFNPEYQFVKRLFSAENAAALKAWVKTPDVGFYDIEYGYQPGGNGRSKRGRFNPDFFLLPQAADEVIVVEVKADNDITDQNAGKLAYALAHFAKVNELLQRQQHKRRYEFHFVSPSDYDDFFASLRDGKLKGFVSGLQAALSA
jgi:type III restriction enzyme